MRPAVAALPASLALSVALLALIALPALARAQSAEPGTSDDAATTAAWEAVARGEAVALMRHALAPGTGDPAGFALGDCATQRNLSDEGRAQARKIGARIADALDDAPVEVFSSAWCRCLETAGLLGLGEPTALAPLNSFFAGRGSRDEQTGALRRWIDERLAADDAPPAVLVTHQVNVSALTGAGVASGEIVVVDAEDTVLARIATVAD